MNHFFFFFCWERESVFFVLGAKRAFYRPQMRQNKEGRHLFNFISLHMHHGQKSYIRTLNEKIFWNSDFYFSFLVWVNLKNKSSFQKFLVQRCEITIFCHFQKWKPWKFWMMSWNNPGCLLLLITLRMKIYRRTWTWLNFSSLFVKNTKPVNDGRPNWWVLLAGPLFFNDTILLLSWLRLKFNGKTNYCYWPYEYSRLQTRSLKMYQ